MQDLPDSTLIKSYEVAYALFRVAAKLPDRSYRSHLEDKALDLIISSLEGNWSLSSRSINTLDYLVRFLGDTGIIHADTSSLLLKELAELNPAIAGFKNPATVFVSKEDLFPNRSEYRKPEAGALFEAKEIFEENQGHISEEVHSENTGVRQGKILEKIRQSGNCRLRDIQGVLPDTSERTLRYDLQRLLQEGILERSGSGPSTFYKIKDEETL